MQSNKARDTKPELRIRRLLHRRGLRFRIDYRASPMLRTRPDIVFTRWKVAVYIDGCFWHGCPVHATTPKANSDYWIPKLARNVDRDVRATEALTGLGWSVLRFWEHESAEDVADAIERRVELAREAGVPSAPASRSDVEHRPVSPGSRSATP